MLKKRLARFKPGAPKQIHLLLASLLWTCVGVLLLSRGLGMLNVSDEWWVLLLGFIAGICKSLFVLDKAAEIGIERILKFADGTCVGAVYSLKTWMLVMVMMAGGYVLRNSSLPQCVVAFVYLTVGSALLLSSRHAWCAWKVLTTDKYK